MIETKISLWISDDTGIGTCSAEIHTILPFFNFETPIILASIAVGCSADPPDPISWENGPHSHAVNNKTLVFFDTVSNKSRTTGNLPKDEKLNARTLVVVAIASALLP